MSLFACFAHSNFWFSFNKSDAWVWKGNAPWFTSFSSCLEFFQNTLNNAERSNICISIKYYFSAVILKTLFGQTWQGQDVWEISNTLNSILEFSRTHLWAVLYAPVYSKIFNFKTLTSSFKNRTVHTVLLSKTGDNFIFKNIFTVSTMHEHPKLWLC